MKPIRRIELEHQPLRVKFSRDGLRLLVTSRYEIVISQLQSTVADIRINPLVAFDAAFLSDTQLALSAWFVPPYEGGKNLAIYDLATQQIVLAVDAGDIGSVCVDPQRQRIFAGGVPSIRVYDFSLNQQADFDIEDSAFDMAISHSGDRLAVASDLFTLWDITADPAVISEACPKESDCTGTPCEANSIDITPAGQLAVVGLHGAKGDFAVFDGESGKIIGWYGPAWDFMTSFDVTSVAIAPNGLYVAVAKIRNRSVDVYRLSDGAVIRQYEVMDCDALAFSPTGDCLAIGDENSVMVWPFAG